MEKFFTGKSCRAKADLGIQWNVTFLNENSTNRFHGSLHIFRDFSILHSLHTENISSPILTGVFWWFYLLFYCTVHMSSIFCLYASLTLFPRYRNGIRIADIGGQLTMCNQIWKNIWIALCISYKPVCDLYSMIVEFCSINSKIHNWLIRLNLP